MMMGSCSFSQTLEVLAAIRRHDANCRAILRIYTDALHVGRGDGSTQGDTDLILPSYVGITPLASNKYTEYGTTRHHCQVPLIRSMSPISLVKM